jgi:hypothetical protein
MAVLAAPGMPAVQVAEHPVPIGGQVLVAHAQVSREGLHQLHVQAVAAAGDEVRVGDAEMSQDAGFADFVQVPGQDSAAGKTQEKGEHDGMLEGQGAHGLLLAEFGYWDLTYRVIGHGYERLSRRGWYFPPGGKFLPVQEGRESANPPPTGYFSGWHCIC